MKKLVFLALCLCSAVAFAQDEVSLVVSADGATKTQAIDNALRSAIEQTFGTFVSANTQILNDELVKDEIATVSSGNIQKYTELGSYTLPNGNVSVSLQVTVSINKLVKYAQSKGSECEFAGATLGANIRLLQLRYNNSIKAFEHIEQYMREMGPMVYDYSIKVEEPLIDNKTNTAIVTMKVSYVPNENTESFFQTIVNTAKNSCFYDERDIAGLRGMKLYEIGQTERWIELIDGNKNGMFNKFYKKNRFLFFPVRIEPPFQESKPFFKPPYMTNEKSLVTKFDEYVLKAFVIKDNNGNIYHFKTRYPTDADLFGYAWDKYSTFSFVENALYVESKHKFGHLGGGGIEIYFSIPIDQLSTISSFSIEPCKKK